jgi:hypothetical protein
MRAVPPLLMWLDNTPLCTFHECIQHLKELEFEGNKIFAKLPLYASSVPNTVLHMERVNDKLSIDERFFVIFYLTGNHAC